MAVIFANILFLLSSVGESVNIDKTVSSFDALCNYYSKYINISITNGKNLELENIRVKEEVKKGRVAIFIGCMSNYTYTNTGDSLVKILKKLDLDIFIPIPQLKPTVETFSRIFISFRR